MPAEVDQNALKSLVDRCNVDLLSVLAQLAFLFTFYSLTLPCEASVTGIAHGTVGLPYTSRKHNCHLLPFLREEVTLQGVAARSVHSESGASLHSTNLKIICVVL